MLCRQEVVAVSRHLDVKLIRESISALLLALVADSIAGLVMNRYVNIFVMIPGLLMVIPALIDMRGNVYGAFISRLSSKLHLGEIEDLHDPKVKMGILSAKMLAYSGALIVGTIAGIFSFIRTGNAVYLMFIPAIILFTHLFTASTLTPLTAYIGVKSYQKGWNPDNVGVPLISSVGDLASVVFILLSAFLLLQIFDYPSLIALVLISILLYVFLIGRRMWKDAEGKRVYTQSLPIIIAVGLLELITGGLWEGNKIGIILLVLPSVLETLGNIGSVFSSRLSSFIYLGVVEPAAVPKGKKMRTEMLSILALSSIIYALISVFVFLVTLDIRAVAMVLISAYSALLILVMLSYYLTVGSLKMKLDPDNVVVPVITTLADIIGTVLIILSYRLLF